VEELSGTLNSTTEPPEREQWAQERKQPAASLVSQAVQPPPVEESRRELRGSWLRVRSSRVPQIEPYPVVLLLSACTAAAAAAAAAAASSSKFPASTDLMVRVEAPEPSGATTLTETAAPLK
jgi:hypothetical protein